MMRDMKSFRALLLCTLPFFFQPTVSAGKDYRNEAIKKTAEVEEFVRNYNIKGSDIEKIHRIIELTHDRFLFIGIGRRRIQEWIQDPKQAEEFKSKLAERQAGLDELYRKRTMTLLTKEEHKKLGEERQWIFFGEHDLMVYDKLISKKDILPNDLPFAVSGAEAVKYRISDGCTTATKAFIVLAKAAGLKEIRFVATGCTSDYNRACTSTGIPRKKEMAISGHFFALVKVQSKWALVNCTYFDPYSPDEKKRYEVFFELDGQPVSPDSLRQSILKIPSFQREGLCHKQLYVIGIGRNGDDDMDIENYDALMNMSVSGDRDSPICKYERF
jgi:hypothetical protein